MKRMDVFAGSGRRASAATGPALSILLLALVGAVPVFASEARVAASLEPSGSVWIGQRVILRVDLKTDGLSFRGQRIRLPDVPGALLLEDAIGTVKLSESIEGETWQVLRYEYPLFVQRAGRIEVPAIDVEFSVMAGFGSEPERFTLRTAPQRVSARVPEGVEDVARLVTTSDFSVRVEYEPEPVGLRVGDAFTRRIVRRAVDLTAMAFAPLAPPELPGIAVYEKAPEVEESRNRGEMLGTRIDATTFVLQEPGAFVIPGFELPWWDPERRRLATERVPDLELEVAANPFWARGGAEPVEEARSWMLGHPWRLAAIVLGAVGAAVWLRSRVRGWWRRVARWRKTRADREAARFGRLVRACRANDPARAYDALRAWLTSPHGEHASSVGDDALTREAARVQAALVGREGGWTGRPLVRAARRARKRRASGSQTAQRRALQELNPRHSAGPHAV